MCAAEMRHYLVAFGCPKSSEYRHLYFLHRGTTVYLAVTASPFHCCASESLFLQVALFYVSWSSAGKDTPLPSF